MVGTPVGMSMSHIQVPGLDSRLPVNEDPGRQQVDQVVGYLLPMWETSVDFPAPGFGPGCHRHKRSDAADGSYVSLVFEYK